MPLLGGGGGTTQDCTLLVTTYDMSKRTIPYCWCKSLLDLVSSGVEKSLAEGAQSSLFLKKQVLAVACLLGPWGLGLGG